jgi:DNA polymerase III epsilon subunit-like protein
MILLSLDFETTGLDVVNDRVIEFGAVLYSTGQKKCLDNQGMLVKTDISITPQITKITGIHPAAVDRFGYEPDDVLGIIVDMMQNADAIIGYNCRRFDRRVIENWAVRAGDIRVSGRLWIDLYQDLPWQVPTGKLGHVAADHGILNLFPHSALADAQTVLAIAEKYDPEELLHRAQSPVVILQARQNRVDNDLVKQAPFKFRWNPTNKIWWKPVKEQDVTEIIQSAPFPITIEKGYAPEELDN